MNKTGVVLHCRNTFLLNRFTVHSSRRTVIRIHEDFLFKRTGQVVFPSDKNCFVRQKPRPPGKGGNICSKVAISEEKKYKSQYQTDGVSMVALPDLNMKKTMNTRLKSVKPITLIIRWMIRHG